MRRQETEALDLNVLSCDLGCIDALKKQLSVNQRIMMPFSPDLPRGVQRCRAIALNVCQAAESFLVVCHVDSVAQMTKAWGP